ncbi:MAG TPA: ABC transporter permease [Anaerolineales bacterium]|nr:ABC transporter permease [Anaerolineales bacterium]
MSLWQSFLEAIGSLSANKTRSSLTMLGIMIGVGAVIALMGLGEGTQASITGEIESIGTNVLFVSSGGEADNPEALTIRDAQVIAAPSLAPSVKNVAPVLQGNVEVSIPGESTSTSLVAITPEYHLVQSADVAQGLPITDDQLENYASIVLLGTDVAEELFNRTTDLIGEKVRLNGQVFTVSGVLEEQGAAGFGSSGDNQVLVPLTTAQLRLLKRASSDEVDLIYVQANNAEGVPAAEEEVAQILRSRHRSTLGEDDFEITTTQSIVDMAETITNTLTLFLGAIAGVSLLVGGIGTMNIMLVTVTERTKEIGLRKAMGARKRDVLSQFLVESSLLSLGGGLIGIMLGFGIAIMVGRLISIDAVITVEVVLLATLFSAAIGLFFGLYPANRAASLEPVEALRSE